MTRSTKMKKYFSQDVRSHYDSGEEAMRDESMDRSSQKGSIRGSIKTKKSVEIPTLPFIDDKESPQGD